MDQLILKYIIAMKYNIFLYLFYAFYQFVNLWTVKEEQRSRVPDSAIGLYNIFLTVCITAIYLATDFLSVFPSDPFLFNICLFFFPVLIFYFSSKYLIKKKKYITVVKYYNKNNILSRSHSTIIFLVCYIGSIVFWVLSGLHYQNKI